jgi:hypothetical protein
MHLLFATSIVPDGSLSSGYEIANETIVDGLIRAGARVTTMGFVWPGHRPSRPDETVVLGELDVRTDTASSLQKVRWLAEAVRSGTTFASAKLRIVDDATILAAMRDAGPFDACVLNGAQMAAAFERCFIGRPTLFVAHNVEAQSAAENARSARDAFQRLLYRREARMLSEIERRLCERASYVFTLADEDLQAFGLASSGRAAVLPLVTRQQPPKAASRRIVHDAVLIGTWTWQPNRVGLDWFLGQVVPHLPGDFSVAVAGSVPADVGCDHPGVSFVGRVPDAQDFVRSGAVVPLVSRGGTGVQLKTIETFELGLASVATTSALRGIAHKPANCVVANDPVVFAAALVETARARPEPVDGGRFHRAQRSELDRRIREALGTLRVGKEALA